MKTIWIIDNYSSEPKYGDISRQYDFAQELSRLGYRTVVISSTFSHYTHSYKSDKEKMVSQIAENAYYVYLRIHAYQGNGVNRAISMFSFCSAVLRNYKSIADELGKPDVVEGCSAHPLSWVAAQRIAVHYKVPFIAEVRDFWPKIFVASGQKSKYDPMVLFFGIIEKWAYKKADKIICSMPHGDRHICEELGFPRDKVFIIGQPMDCKSYDRRAKTGMASLPQKVQDFISDGFVCVYTGYYQEYDGVHVMLEAAKLLQERGLPIKMLFLGSGPEYDRMKIYQKSNGLNNVLIGERVSKEYIPAVLRRADICLAHCAYKGVKITPFYGFSKNKINEYMYSKACIIFGCEDPEDPVATSGAGFVIPPFDPTAFATIIEKVYKMSPDDRNEFGKNGCEYTLKYHSVENLAIELLKIYGL